MGVGVREGARVTGLVAVVQYIAAKEKSAMNFFVKPNHDFFLRFVFLPLVPSVPSLQEGETKTIPPPPSSVYNPFSSFSSPPND